MAGDEIRVDFPFFGELGDRAIVLLEEGVKQGGIFIRASDELQPGRALEMAFVDQQGIERYSLRTFVTKVRRTEPHEQVFICFAQLNDAREALRQLRDMVNASDEASLVSKAERGRELEPEPETEPERDAPLVEVTTTGEVSWEPDGLEVPDSVLPEEPVIPDETPTGEDSLQNPRVIIVHPDLLTRESISQELMTAGFMVSTTDDGLNALMALESFDAEAILSWARVSRLAGYELPAALRKRDETRKIAVVVMAAAGDDEAIRAAENGGADVVLEQPVTTTEMAKAIRRAIRQLRP